jgi:hypothetical protein
MSRPTAIVRTVDVRVDPLTAFTVFTATVSQIQPRS